MTARHALRFWFGAILFVIGLCLAPAPSPNDGASPYHFVETSRGMDSAAWAETPLVGPGRALIGGNQYAPTISQNFLSSPSLPSWLTYTGASLKTVQDSTGAITYGGNNLLKYSNTFSNAVWINVTTTVTSGVSDPFGGNNAYTLTANGTSSFIYQSLLPANTNGVVSVWARIRTAAGLQELRTPSNTSNGTTITSGTWTKISNYGNTGASTGYMLIYQSTVGGQIDVYAATASAVTYETTEDQRQSHGIDDTNGNTPTTSAAYYGAPFDYGQGLRAWQGITNLFLNSGAPATQTITVANATAYNISFWGTGTLVGAGACTFTLVGVAATLNTTSCTTATTSLVLTDTSLTSTAYPQVETGTFPGPRCFSGASAGVCAADVYAFAAPALGVLQGTSGAFVVEDGGSASAIGDILGWTATNSPNTYLFSNTAVQSNGSANVTSGTGVAQTGQNRVGVSWSNTGRTVAYTGATTASASSLITNGNAVIGAFLGSNFGQAYFLNGHISRIALFNRALPASVLQNYTKLGTFLVQGDPANDNVMFAANDNVPWLNVVGMR